MKEQDLYLALEAVDECLLEETESKGGRGGRGRYLKWGTLAACAALLIGLGIRHGAPAGSGRLPVSSPVGDEPPAISKPVPDTPLPRVDYGERGQSGGSEADIALPEGSFFRDLTGEDLEALLGEWAGELEREGAELSGNAVLLPDGTPWTAHVFGRRISGGEEDFSFSLAMAPDALPLTCAASPADGVTDCWGVEVTGRYGGIYGEGAGREVWLPESREVEFVAGGVGYRFRFYGPEGEGEWVESMVGRFLRYGILGGGADLDSLAVGPEEVPAWREESFDTLDQARRESDFAPYLPERDPAGYGDFYGRLSYQEGVRNSLFVRWSRGYDEVEVSVSLPEGEGREAEEPVDVRVPESWDWRLYEGAIYGSTIPEEYQDGFFSPVFRAEELSPDVVEGRMRPHDTGGESCRFSVLYDSGAVASYTCSGLSAREVWEIAEGTL